MEEKTLLEIVNLRVEFATYNGKIYAVRGVDFSLNKGETLGIVGESGCGKSVTSKAITRLLGQTTASVTADKMLFDGVAIESYRESEMQKIRGSKMSMIFQDPMTSLNPTKRVGVQIMEPLLKHTKMSKAEAKVQALKMLELVGIPNVEMRFKQYPHQFSGGMRQRAMIALAMVNHPQLLIADEPTTALDVTIQAQILELMKKIQKEFDTSIIMITHNLGVIANIADRIAVMYAGMIVEIGTAREIFYEPKHPYTWGLLNSIPNLETERKQELIPIVGTPPDLYAPPLGCPFAPRCPYCMRVCENHMPDTDTLSITHKVNCWLNDERAEKVERPMISGGKKHA